ncbi:mCG1030106 [Mus musculus]|nr:mCG1030106 [Mus musculus]
MASPIRRLNAEGRGDPKNHIVIGRVLNLTLLDYVESHTHLQ